MRQERLAQRVLRRGVLQKDSQKNKLRKDVKMHRIHATRTQLRVHAAHQLPVQAHHNLPTPSTILLHGQIFPHNQDSNYYQHLHANMFSYQGTTFFFFQWHCDVTVCSCTFDHDATPATAIMFGATVPPEFYCILFFVYLTTSRYSSQNCVIFDVFSYHIGQTCTVQEFGWSRNGAFNGTRKRPRRTSLDKIYQFEGRNKVSCVSENTTEQRSNQRGKTRGFVLTKEETKSRSNCINTPFEQRSACVWMLRLSTRPPWQHDRPKFDLHDRSVCFGRHAGTSCKYNT